MPTKQRTSRTPKRGDTVRYQGAPHAVTWVGHGGIDPTSPLRLEIKPTVHSGPACEIGADELD